MNLGAKLDGVDEPKEILDGIVEARKKLLMGFKGNKNVSKKKFEEACNPTLFTFSLSGEPTIYPRLGELIREVRGRGAVSFLVTNGLNPEAIEKLEKEGNLPTQLTVSCLPNRELFEKWCRCSKKNGWEEFLKSLDLFKKLEGKTRRALRLTLVKEKNMSDKNVLEYAKLIKKAEPDFVHVKGFMSVGWARERLGYAKMPWHSEVRDFAEKLVEELKKEDYKILDEVERSCVVLIGRSGVGLGIEKV
tara:strand:- start:3276 stop:4016 length:741 start_codon:yes stop_codon:yes gene_type:complete